MSLRLTEIFEPRGIVISSEPEGKMWKQMGVELVHKCLREWISMADTT